MLTLRLLLNLYYVKGSSFKEGELQDNADGNAHEQMFSKKVIAVEDLITKLQSIPDADDVVKKNKAKVIASLQKAKHGDIFRFSEDKYQDNYYCFFRPIINHDKVR